jgi:hypothetical protein
MDLHGVALRRLYVLVFIEHGTWSVHLAGIAAHPSGAFHGVLEAVYEGADPAQEVFLRRLADGRGGPCVHDMEEIVAYIRAGRGVAYLPITITAAIAPPWGDVRRRRGRPAGPGSARLGRGPAATAYLRPAERRARRITRHRVRRLRSPVALGPAALGCGEFPVRARQPGRRCARRL